MLVDGQRSHMSILHSFQISSVNPSIRSDSLKNKNAVIIYHPDTEHMQCLGVFRLAGVVLFLLLSSPSYPQFWILSQSIFNFKDSITSFLIKFQTPFPINYSLWWWWWLQFFGKENHKELRWQWECFHCKNKARKRKKSSMAGQRWCLFQEKCCVKVCPLESWKQQLSTFNFFFLTCNHMTACKLNLKCLGSVLEKCPVIASKG